MFSKPKDLEPAVKIGDGILGSVFIFKKIAFDYNIPKGCEIDIYNPHHWQSIQLMFQRNKRKGDSLIISNCCNSQKKVTSIIQLLIR